jgi:hypothetical protein
MLRNCRAYFLPSAEGQRKPERGRAMPDEAGPRIDDQWLLAADTDWCGSVEATLCRTGGDHDYRQLRFPDAGEYGARPRTGMQGAFDRSRAAQHSPAHRQQNSRMRSEGQQDTWRFNRGRTYRSDRTLFDAWRLMRMASDEGRVRRECFRRESSSPSQARDRSRELLNYPGCARLGTSRDLSRLKACRKPRPNCRDSPYDIFHMQAIISLRFAQSGMKIA